MENFNHHGLDVISSRVCLALDDFADENGNIELDNSTHPADNDIIDIPDDKILLLARSILNLDEGNDVCKRRMKVILEYWQKNAANNIRTITLFPVKNKEDLRKIIRCAVSVNPNANLNWINVSKIKDMSFLFWQSHFNGDISKWDVSNVEDMFEMFYASDFNNDISKWNVAKVRSMKWMFLQSKFTRNICDWTISNETKTDGMFMDCPIASTNKPMVLQLQK